MAETKQIGCVHVVTDSETSYDNIGDIQAGFDDTALKKHIQNHGHIQLCEKLAYMQFQVWQTMQQINREKAATDHGFVITNS